VNAFRRNVYLMRGLLLEFLLVLWALIYVGAVAQDDVSTIFSENPVDQYPTYSTKRIIPDSCIYDHECTPVGGFPSLCCVNATCQLGNCALVKCISNIDCNDSSLCCDVFGMCDICPAAFSDPVVSPSPLSPSTSFAVSVAVPAVLGVVACLAVAGTVVGVVIVHRRSRHRKELHALARVHPTPSRHAILEVHSQSSPKIAWR